MAKVTINLNGPEGNAWVLMGYGRSVCKATNRDWKPIKEQMMSGDYENLVRVFKENFGDYYRIVRK